MPPRRRVATTRACDWCRQRKVKCDAAETCANCRISQLPCRYTLTPKKRGPKVPRICKVTPDPDQCMQDWTGSPSTSGFSLDPSPVSVSPQQHILPSKTASPQRQRQESESPVSSLPGPAPACKVAQALRDDLLAVMDSALPAMSALEAVNRCIDLYMQYTFPTAPFVHEPTLRGAAAHLFSRTGSSEFFRCRPSRHEEVAEMRSFALVTAVCASIASVVPDTLLPSRTSIAGPCLSASRNMMKVFEEFDVEYPSSDSIATRLLHTTALQHTTGKACLSNYTLGQAAYLAQNMRLYSEEALKRHNPLEAQLLRNLFWHMYAADKAATCLGSRPISLHELLFNETMTVCPDTTVSISLFDTARPCYDRTFESRLLVGFYFAPRLWSKAASLIFGIKAYRRGDQASTKAQLTQVYLEFIAILDDLPYWLQVSKIIVSTDDSEDVQFQKTAFWVQRCTILVVYQCLRLVILQQSIENEVEDIMGLRGQDLTTSMIKIDMIRDFIQTLDDIPFVYLQVKGEPTIERIRWVGSVILELLDSRTDKMIMVRANHYFTRLLDLLARLDSKSSDVLGELKEHSQTTAWTMFP